MGIAYCEGNLFVNYAAASPKDCLAETLQILQERFPLLTSQRLSLAPEQTRFPSTETHPRKE